MATTLGDLCPELKHCRPTQKKPQKPPRKGTAHIIKDIYPEIESWDNVFVTQVWFRWLRSVDQPLTEPTERDERFPMFLVETIRQRMVETGEWR
ncbi:hypothetical protein [Enterobacter kobei]|jgi:hypothetical protein|uniref:Uncharacterized protein n=1 Tax=Enterobacter kobei TaxID=208224 RepID=A0AA86IV79_9ENTR|nr:hypothetical protein [Enterobacter kobei]BCU57799.1 hypothetical protein ENKO_43930 [Enterobacter kobei]SIR87016.1 hypothetical protein SAMN05444841_1362 [Enterobacter kobei]